MKQQIGKKGLAILLFMAVFFCCLSGCALQPVQENLTITGFAFDTTYTITLYEGGTQEILDSCVEKCSSYERIFSRTSEGSELYQINEIEEIYLEKVMLDLTKSTLEMIPEQNKEAGNDIGEYRYSEKSLAEIARFIEGKKPENNTIDYEIYKDGSISFQLSDELYRIIAKGLEYSKASEGRFDITVEPLTSLWDFKAENPAVPEKVAVEAALQQVGYEKLSLSEKVLRISEPGVGLDLGGIAKGFIADDLKAYLMEQGVTGATINLGGNLLCIGGKNEKEAFHIGIQQPFADRNETIAAVKVKDFSVVSSGIYERYFKTEDGILYHHILDPRTGYSYENDLLGVTILSEKSVDGDALSTTCFAMGKEKGIAYVNSLDDVYALFITKDEKLWYSKGFEAFLLDS